MKFILAKPHNAKLPTTHFLKKISIPSTKNHFDQIPSTINERKGDRPSLTFDASDQMLSFGSIETKMAETLGGDARTRLYFDAIDKAHELLENHKDLSKAIPSCVVVGMQSVGKSAVLSRVSGIPFPQDSEVCTRVAMELRLRRCSNGKADTNITAGTSPVSVNADSNKSIESALKKAQLDVLKGRKFEDKLSVKIDKTNKAAS